MNRSTVTVRRLDGGDEPLKGSAVTLFEDVSALSTRHGRPVPAPVMEGCLAALGPGARMARASLVQAECWGWLLAPHPPDLVAISPTGSGKTLAFLLPLIADLAAGPPPPPPPVTDVLPDAGALAELRIAPDGGGEGEGEGRGASGVESFEEGGEGGEQDSGLRPPWQHGCARGCEQVSPVGLVLAPTRELCLQTAEVARRVASHTAPAAPRDLSQRARGAALASFRRGEAEVLVATDVAARGLDVPSVAHVVNLSGGLSIDAYLHRGGQCGQGGMGVSHTFVTEGNAPLAPVLVQLLERRLSLLWVSSSNLLETVFQVQLL
ncbi:hypothetical protein EMIHUDRAFT_221221 [Emiliania huxleyi CCMP1516]|uniref:Helicase C-terminal domain-containing protein n=2 Tax=Emiliania huxleyi TaxID=2903 RepID=A0A0D3HZH2_EMIH1|nr:hypothetical protein EMIHUDRAFT_221221 [Emiliania huxleyi CCMP1516]EOD04407.1 hypothetical protein EMIHUDRAFT_221221 [Emiliania huxleyi CCMP1516]|eukprot:XP_005756836.1 hypothetical protein EMIHUDRAFT_221221 [Emiliania huxleyi CCMP1516]